MRSTVILIDAGHGGIVEGEYQTSGNRYEGIHMDNPIFLAEGAFNRAVAFGLQAKLHLNNIPSHIVNPEHEDISLQARARRVNAIARRKTCVLLSIHHNYFDSSSARGAEFFTSRGDSAADPIAEHIASFFRGTFPDERLRTNQINPSKLSKEAGYYILKSTICPAVLTEWGFMSNEHDRRRIFDINSQVDFFTDAIIDLFECEHLM